MGTCGSLLCQQAWVRASASSAIGMPAPSGGARGQRPKSTHGKLGSVAGEGAGAAGLAISVKHAGDRLRGWNRVQPPSLSFYVQNTGVTGSQGGNSQPATVSRLPPPARPVWGCRGALGCHRDWGATGLGPGEAPHPAASWLLLGPNAKSGACPHEESPLWTHYAEMAREGDGALGRLRVLVQAGLAPAEPRESA